MVEVSPYRSAFDQVRYVLVGFEGIVLNDFAATTVVLKWNDFWARGEDPQ
jgi:hypothetical protein